jgi:hypothetical protein
MAKPHIRLTEKDNKMIQVIQKKMEKLGFVDPNASDAVRFALGLAAR